MRQPLVDGPGEVEQLGGALGFSLADGGQDPCRAFRDVEASFEQLGDDRFEESERAVVAAGRLDKKRRQGELELIPRFRRNRCGTVQPAQNALDHRAFCLVVRSNRRFPSVS